MKQLAMIFILLTFMVNALANEISTLSQLEQELEEIREKTGTAGMAVAIIEKGEPVWIKTFGESDIENDVNVEENTMFRIGSTTKMFVSLAALKLRDEGRLDFNARLSELWPEFKFSNPWEETNPVRFVHLLEHTTGWHDMHYAEYAAIGSDFESLAHALDFHPDSRVSRWVPGTRMSYSNIGPGVAAAVIERITGQLFEEYAEQNFFQALGMNHTNFFNDALFKQHAANLYFRGKKQSYWDILYRPSGAANSTISDMAKFLAFYLNRGKVNDAQLMSEQSLKRMETPKSSLAADAGVLAGYGLGNYSSGSGQYGVTFYGHNGGVMGGLTELVYSPELGSGFVTLINSSSSASYESGELIRKYLLRNRQINDVGSVELPSEFKNASGWYQPINPRVEGMRLLTDFIGAISVRIEDDRLVRSPLTGEWSSSDYAIENSDVLIDVWTGLPSIAFAQDPLAGEVLVASAGVYKQVSVVKVWFPIVWLAVLFMLTLVAVIVALIFMVQKLRGRTALTWGSRLWLAPLACSFYLIFHFFLLTGVGADFLRLGSMNLGTISVFISSLLYPFIVFCSLLHNYRIRSQIRVNMNSVFSILLLASHLIFTGYFLSYDQAGLMTWQ